MAVGKKFLDLIFRVDTKEASKNVDGLGKGLKSVGKSGKIASGGLKMMSGGFKAIGVAIKAAGIGLFIGLLSQLTGMFQSNQKVADTFSRIMLKLKPVFDAVGDVIAFVAGVLEGLIDMFSSAVGWLGSLIGVTDSAAQSTTNMANEIVKLRNEVKLMNAELALTQLEYQKEAEVQRQLRDDTSKSIDERIAANEKLGQILEEQFQEERRMAEMGLELAQKELVMDEDNIDLQVAVIEAKTKLAEIDERLTGQRSEQLTNLNSLEQERSDKAAERSKAIKEELEAEKKAYEDIRKELRKNIEVEEEDLSLLGQLQSAQDAHNLALEHLEKLKNKDISITDNNIKASKNRVTQIENEIEGLKQLNEELAGGTGFDHVAEEKKKRVAKGFHDIIDIMTVSHADMCGEFTDFQRLTRHFFEKGSGIEQLLERTASTNRKTGEQIVSDAELLGDLNLEQMMGYVTDIQMIMLNLSDPDQVGGPMDGMDQWILAFEKMKDHLPSAAKELFEGGIFKDIEGGFSFDMFGREMQEGTQELEWYSDQLMKNLVNFMIDYERALGSADQMFEEHVTGQIANNESLIEDKKNQIQTELDLQEGKGQGYLDLEAEHQQKVLEAEQELEEVLCILREQSQAVVDEFRKSAQQKEIDKITKHYNDIIQHTIEGSEDHYDLVKERDAAILEIRNKDANDLLALIAKNQKELSDLNKTAEELEIEELAAKYQVMLDMADQLQMDETEIERMKQEELAGIKKHYADLEIEEQKKRNEETIDNALSMMDSILSLTKTSSDKEMKELDKKLKKGVITEENYNRQLLVIQREQLKKEKKAAMLQIGVDTAKGISSAVAAGAGLVFPANLAAITTGIAAVLAGVAQASSVLGQSVEAVDNATSDIGGGGGGGNLSGDAPSIPTFGAIGTDAPPIQAFVVESDVSDAQALQNELNLQSTL